MSEVADGGGKSGGHSVGRPAACGGCLGRPGPRRSLGGGGGGGLLRVHWPAVPTVMRASPGTCRAHLVRGGCEGLKGTGAVLEGGSIGPDCGVPRE